jgi:hypothetical protein
MSDINELDLTAVSTDEFGVTYSKDKTRLLKANYELLEYTIPDGTEEICAGAFDDCHSLRAIVVPNSVTKIADCAFGRCFDLESIVPPNVETHKINLENAAKISEKFYDEMNIYYDQENFAIVETNNLPNSSELIKIRHLSDCIFVLFETDEYQYNALQEDKKYAEANAEELIALLENKMADKLKTSRESLSALLSALYNLNEIIAKIYNEVSDYYEDYYESDRVIRRKVYSLSGRGLVQGLVHIEECFKNLSETAKTILAGDLVKVLNHSVSISDENCGFNLVAIRIFAPTISRYGGNYN